MEKLLGRQGGFALIEATSGMFMLIIGALATCSAFVVGSQFNAQSEDKTIASNIAQLKMEEIKNTHNSSIVYEHPAGETMFEHEPQEPPYWTCNSEGIWIPSLPDGKYEISYPGLDLDAGIVPDPLVVEVTISWGNDICANSSLCLRTIYSTNSTGG